VYELATSTSRSVSGGPYRSERKAFTALLPRVGRQSTARPAGRSTAAGGRVRRPANRSHRSRGPSCLCCPARCPAAAPAPSTRGSRGGDRLRRRARLLLHHQCSCSTKAPDRRYAPAGAGAASMAMRADGLKPLTMR
jgi:hypothetical protein